MTYSVLRYPEGDIAAVTQQFRPGRETLADSDPEIVAFLATNPPAIAEGWVGAFPVTAVTNLQMRRALRQSGAFSSVNSYLRGPSAPEDALDAWDYANVFYYTDPTLDLVVSALGLNKRALFALASTK